MGVCLALGGYGLLTAWLVPLTVRVAYDPSLQYMLSSLAWFRGDAYGYVDHPGTPVEILGTGLLLVSHPFVWHASDLISFHLANPQYFLSVAQTLVVMGSVAVCVWLGWQAIEVTHWSLALVAVATSGLYFAAHPMAFATLAEWSHESFNFPAGTGLSLGLLVLLRRPTRPSLAWVLAFGFGAGVLTSIQLYFAAWVLGTAVAVGVAGRMHGLSWRTLVAQTGAVPGMAAVGFVVSTLPIRDRYPAFIDWVWRLLSHQQTYGEGAPGFSTPELMAANAGAEFGQAPVLAVALVVVGAVLVWRLVVDAGGSRRDVALWSVGLGLAAQSLAIVLLAAKHPGLKYLLPLAATLPIVLAAALGRIRITRASTAVAATVGFLGIVGFAANVWSAIVTHVTLNDELTAGDRATEALLVRAATDRGTTRESLRTLWTYGTTSPCYALWFGDETTGQAFNPDISRLCPRDLNLSVFSDRVIATGSSIPVEEFRGWDCALIPQELVATRPAAMPRGSAVSSSVPSLGYGNVVLILNTD